MVSEFSTSETFYSSPFLGLISASASVLVLITASAVVGVGLEVILVTSSRAAVIPASSLISVTLVPRITSVGLGSSLIVPSSSASIVSSLVITSEESLIILTVQGCDLFFKFLLG